MKVFTIRDVPDEVYITLKNWAKANHRSMQEQVKYILEREVQLIGRGSGLAGAREWRDRLKGRDWGDVDISSDIRKERDR